MNQFPINALYSNHTGTNSTTPFVEFFSNRDPTIYDINFPIQKRWFNILTNAEFILVAFNTMTGFTEADWRPIGADIFPPGGLNWTEVIFSQNMVINNGYVTNSGSLITLTLPATAVFGSVLRISGKGIGGWSIAQNALQQIKYGTSNSTIGASGSLSSSYFTDGIEILATTGGSSTIWTVISDVGNLTII